MRTAHNASDNLRAGRARALRATLREDVGRSLASKARDRPDRQVDRLVICTIARVFLEVSTNIITLLRVAQQQSWRMLRRRSRAGDELGRWPSATRLEAKTEHRA